MFFYHHSARASLQIAQDTNAPLVVPVPDIFQQLQDGASLQAFLGNYDISPLVTYRDLQLNIHFSGAVDTGKYPLKIELLMPDGQSYPLVKDTLFVGQAIWKNQSALRTLGTYGTADSDNNAFAESVRKLSESALRLQASRLSGRTLITSSADIQHQSNNQTVSGDKLEVANYHIGIRQETAIGDLGFAVGNQIIEQQGLVFNGFNRRGLQAYINGQDDDYHLSTFLINTDPTVSSKENLLVAGAQREQSHGALFDVAIFDEHLRIGGSYIDGQSELLGNGIQYSNDFYDDGAELVIYGGSSWSINAQSNWLDEALLFELEKAWSSFDWDGIDRGNNEDRASANRYLINIKSYGRLQPLLTPIGVDYWYFSWQQQTVEPDFYSIANIGLPNDLRTDQATLQLAWQRVQLALNYAKASNNVENDSDMPTQDSTQQQLTLNYTPAISDNSALVSILGHPSVVLTLNNTERYQSPDDAWLSGYNLDDVTREYQVSLSFQRERLSWSVQHSHIDFTNQATELESGGLVFFLPEPDSINRFTTFNVSYMPTPNLSLNPSAQWSRYSEKENETQQDAFNVGINSHASMLQDALTFDLNYNLSDQNSDYGFGFPGQEYQTQTASFMVSWKAIKAVRSNAGLTLSLRQLWHQQKNTYQSAYESYQIVLGIDIYWESGN